MGDDKKWEEISDESIKEANARAEERRQKAQKRAEQRKMEVQRQRRALIGAVGALAIVLILVFALKSCGSENASQPSSAATGNGQTASHAALSTTEAQSTTSSAATASPTSITMSFVGDVVLGKDENFDYETSMNAYYDENGADYFLEKVKPAFSSDDLTVINMEGTLTTADNRADKTFAFKADPSYVDILKNASVEAANVANNHSHDYGDQSLTDTINTLENAGIRHFGYNDVALLNVNGIKVGLVGTYELAKLDGIASSMEDNLARVRNQGAELVVAVFHWGVELDTCPDEYQVKLAHDAIDHGADLVIGHHPHVLQGIEYYNDKPIAYSLGNFCFGGNTHPSEMDTIIFQTTYERDSSGTMGDPVLNIIPCSISSSSSINDYQPHILNDGSSVEKKLVARSQEIADTYGASSVYAGS